MSTSQPTLPPEPEQSPLLPWLNDTIKLSSKVTNIPSDFRNGYLFAEILHKHSQIPNFSSYTNQNDKASISKNYQYLTKALEDLHIKFSDERRNQILSQKKGIAAQVLFQIKQALDRKLVSKETLIPNKRNELHEIYKQSLFPNDNEKYYQDLLNRQSFIGKTKLTPLDKFAKKVTNQYDLDIIDKIRQDEAYLQKEHDIRMNNIKHLEQVKAEAEKIKDKENYEGWQKQMVIKREFDKEQKRKFWEECEYYKKAVLDSFKSSEYDSIKSMKAFSDTLSRLGLDIIDENLKQKTLKGSDSISTAIIMRRIQDRMKEKEQSKKDKAKRERKRRIELLKSEQESNNLHNDEHNKQAQQVIIDNLTKQKENIIKNIKSKTIEYEKWKELHRKHSVTNIITPPIKEEEKITLPYKSLEDNFDKEYFFTQLEKETLITLQQKQNKKQLKRKQYVPNIKSIVDMLIDITLKSEEYLQDKNTNLIDIPDWNKWMELFKENKALTSFKEETKDIITTKEINPNDLNENNYTIEMINHSQFEMFDYINYFNGWKISNKQFIKDLQLYDILGNDIAFMLAGGKVQINGLKESQLRSMPNEAFEPGKADYENLKMPKDLHSNPNLGEIIEIGIDIVNEAQHANTSIQGNSGNNEQSKEMFTFHHIPIKACFIGHMFSGRKTQCKFISENFPNIKIYNINDLIKNALDIYERIKTPIENLPKFKSMKKNQIDQLKLEREEEEQKHSFILNLIEPLANNTITTLNDKDIIELLLYQIKIDFPLKSQTEIENEVNTKKERLDQIEQELIKLKEEAQNTKKAKNKAKDESNLESEKQSLIQNSYRGFIITDFPTTYNQFKLLEQMANGFEELISQPKTQKEETHNNLLFHLDRPNHSIIPINSSSFKSIFDAFVYINASEHESLRRASNRKLDPHTNIIYHMEDNPPPEDKKIKERLVDVNEPSIDDIKSNIHNYDMNINQIKEFTGLFKCNITINETSNPNDMYNDIKSNVIIKLLEKYEDKYSTYFGGAVSPLKANQSSNKNVINNNSSPQQQQQQPQQHRPPSIIVDNLDYVETSNVNESISNIGNIHSLVNVNPIINANAKYQKRLNEAKRKLGTNNQTFTLIMSKWTAFNNEYTLSLKKSFINIKNIKDAILTYMTQIQNNFKSFLNKPSDKAQLINIFITKFNSFRTEYENKIPYNFIVKEEFNKDLNELTDGLWRIINKRKNTAISELNKLRTSNFISNHTMYFFDNIKSLYLYEADKLILSLSIIKDFYYSLIPETIRNSTSLPICYIDNIINNKLKAKDIFNGINELQFKHTTHKNVYPQLERIYLNAMKLIFKFDYTVRQIETNIKSIISFTSNNMNSLNTPVNELNDMSTISHGKKRKKKKTRMTPMNHSNSNIFNDSQLSGDEYTKDTFQIPEELKNALDLEKMKFKYRITSIKQYAIETMSNIDTISNDVYEILDEWIIDSVKKQNSTMNELISYLKRLVEIGVKQMNWEFELDTFDKLYKPIQVKFEMDNFFDESNKDSDKWDEYITRDIHYTEYIKELYKVYADSKSNVLQGNYIVLNCLNECVVKKHFTTISENKRLPLYKMGYHQFGKFINKVIMKFNDDNMRKDLINVNHFFCVFALISFNLPNEQNVKTIQESICDKLIDHCFISKDVYNSITFWYEDKEERMNIKASLTMQNQGGYDMNENVHDKGKGNKMSTTNTNTVKEFLYELFKNSDNNINIDELLSCMQLKNIESNISSIQQYKTYFDLFEKD